MMHHKSGPVPYQVLSPSRVRQPFLQQKRLLHVLPRCSDRYIVAGRERLRSKNGFGFLEFMVQNAYKQYFIKV